MIVSDSGPLIAFAKTGYLNLLQQLFATVWIPPLVLEECTPRSDRPGAVEISNALMSGWLKISEQMNTSNLPPLLPSVDEGEAQAIYVAMRERAKLLLIDDKNGRRAAKVLQIPVMGTGGILLNAKRAGFISRVTPKLEEFKDIGYHFSNELARRIIELADED
jgi:hypothetical protein